MKNFERGFSLLFNRKPTKRKNKINKILQEQQAVLTKERIFINPQGSNLLKQSNSKIISSIGQQQMSKDRKEKTIKALRYIKKYQHLYQDEILASSQVSDKKKFPIAKQKIGNQTQSNKFINIDHSRDVIMSQRHHA